MMTIREAKAILAEITVTPEQIEKSKKYMLDKIEASMKSKAYQRQGGVLFEFSDDSVAWIAIWHLYGKTYHLTERGENIYCGEDADKCAEMLYKLGIAHKMYGKKFLGCS